MVADKYTRLAPLARLSSLSVLRPSCTSKVGEVIYSLVENKTDISIVLPEVAVAAVTTPTGACSHLPEANSPSKAASLAPSSLASRSR